MKKRVMELDQNGQCFFGCLQEEAGYSVMVMIISWESQEFNYDDDCFWYVSKFS